MIGVREYLTDSRPVSFSVPNPNSVVTQLPSSRRLQPKTHTLPALAFKGIEQFIWQRPEEGLRDSEFVLCEADRPFGFSRRSHRANFSHRRIPFAKEDGFSFREPIQILRKMGLGLMYIQPDHSSLLNWGVN
jgi:hypothetical protein